MSAIRLTIDMVTDAFAEDDQRPAEVARILHAAAARIAQLTDVYDASGIPLIDAFDNNVGNVVVLPDHGDAPVHNNANGESK